MSPLQLPPLGRYAILRARFVGTSTERSCQVQIHKCTQQLANISEGHGIVLAERLQDAVNLCASHLSLGRWPAPPMHLSASKGNGCQQQSHSKAVCSLLTRSCRVTSATHVYQLYRLSLTCHRCCLLEAWTGSKTTLQSNRDHPLHEVKVEKV